MALVLMQRSSGSLFNVILIQSFIHPQGYTPLGHILVLITFILSLVVIFGLMWYFVSWSKLSNRSLTFDTDFFYISAFLILCSSDPFAVDILCIFVMCDTKTTCSRNQNEANKKVILSLLYFIVLNIWNILEFCLTLIWCVKIRHCSIAPCVVLS